MNFSLSLLFAMAHLLMATAQIQEGGYKTGGLIPADPTRPDVVQAANFALNERYFVEDITYKILSASDRVVAGRLYYLKIAVTETDPASCTVMSYEVWDKAGAPADNQYTLQSAKEQFNEKC